MRGVLEATGLLDDERLRGGYTVLAPTDEAFTSLSLGDAADLAAYPRDEARDATLAWEAGVDVLFAPPTEEIYPGFNHYVRWAGRRIPVLRLEP